MGTAEEKNFDNDFCGGFILKSVGSSPGGEDKYTSILKII